MSMSIRYDSRQHIFDIILNFTLSVITEVCSEAGLVPLCIHGNV